MAKRKNSQTLRLQGIIALLLVILAVLALVALNPPAQPDPTDPPVLQAPSTEPAPATDPSTQPTWPLQTGWVEMNGETYYFEGGAPVRGPHRIDGQIYCFDENGALLGAGWQELDGQKYYLNADGTPLTGWQTLEEVTFYFLENGTMARGEVEISGIKHFFTETGAQVLLVNPWNYVPQDYTVELVELSSAVAVSGQKVDKSCYDALVRMINDGIRAGHDLCIVSSYRTQAHQESLYENQVLKQMSNFGYSREEAEVVAATISAIPGTSEHQLGLAVDIVDTQSWDLSEIQETLAGQQWLMENSWRYGFILRYPNGKTAETGIIYEPWHYRYVGTELAARLHETGLTLEAYLAALTQQQLP